MLKVEQVGDSPVPNATLYIHGLGSGPLIEKFNQAGSIEDRQYVYGPTGLLAIVHNGETNFVLKDHLGSTRVVLNSANQAVSWYDYSPFGDYWRSPIVTPRSSYQFTGQEYDEETCLHNFKARIYDSELGRFYTMDAVKSAGSTYSYAANNSIMFTDPSGMDYVPQFSPHSRSAVVNPAF